MKQTIKINLAKNVFLKTLVKLINNLWDWSRIQETEIVNIKNKNGDITTDPTNIENFVRKQKQFHANKFGNWD